MSTQIRRATGADAFALAALAVQRGREHGAAPDRAFLARWADAWLADQPARIGWVATDDGAPVGALTARVAPGLPRLGEPARLVAGEVDLYVSAPRRRCGSPPAAATTAPTACWPRCWARRAAPR